MDDGFIDAVPTDYPEPGETATIDVDDQPITVANADARWCAFESTRPHRATPLGGLLPSRRVLLWCPKRGSISTSRRAKYVLASQDGRSVPDLDDLATSGQYPCTSPATSCSGASECR